MKNRFIQFELWKDCNNHCNFCYNKGNSDINKLFSLLYVIRKLNEKESDYYNEIGIIGGEFFDDQIDDLEVNRLFYTLIDLLITKINQHKINKVYLATSLIYNSDKHLLPLLNYLKEKKALSNFLLCTSFDLKYRFKSNGAVIWKNNMRYLSINYPELLLHTEMILSNCFMRAVTDFGFDLKKFSKKYNTRIDYIEANSGYNSISKCKIKDFLPTKKQSLKFIDYIFKNDVIDLSCFLSNNLISDRLYCSKNGEFILLDDRKNREHEDVVKEVGITLNRAIADSNATFHELFKSYCDITK